MKPALAKDSVMVELRKVRDPEIGHSIVDLGLIYNVTITGNTVDVLMTLTTPFCPASEYLMTSVQDAIEGLGGKPHVELTFEPAWGPDKITPELRSAMGFDL